MSATFSASHGASTLELQQKHNWSNAQMALEYIGYSAPHQAKMASYIQRAPVDGPPMSTGPVLTRPKYENNVSTKRKSRLTLGRDQGQSTTPAPPQCKYFLLLTL